MSYLKSVLQEEHDRLKSLVEKYKNEISLLPRGSLSVKKRNQREYLYLAYRQEGRVKFEYIGTMSSEKAKFVIKQIESRKEYENKFKLVKKDLVEIERVINGRKI